MENIDNLNFVKVLSHVDNLRKNILDKVVPAAKILVPESIDEKGKLKSSYEFFVVFSILCYQDYVSDTLLNGMVSVKNNG